MLKKFLGGKKNNSLNNSYCVMGSNVIDETIELGEKLSDVNLGEKIRIKEDFKKTVGGGGVNISIAISKLGGKVSYLGKHSFDSYDLVKSDLEKNNVNCIKSKLSDVGCAKSVILDTEDSDRVIFTFRGQNSLLEMSDFDIDNINCDYFYLTSLQGKSFETQMDFIDKMKNKNSDSIFCYGASSTLVGKEKRLNELIKKCDIIILNLDEAKILSGCSEINDCLKNIFYLGVSVVVITDGKNGSYVFDGKRDYFSPCVKSKVIDATGAGDCYGATFFYFYTNGYSIEECMKFASLNSSNVVSFKGAHLGLLNFESIVSKK